MNTFACTRCGVCCSNLGATQMVLLLRRDIAAIARALGQSDEDVATRFCEINAELTMEAGIEVLQMRSQGGRCVFLTDDLLCGIHQAKPFQCANGPDQMLQNAMSADYACMKGVKVDPAKDKTVQFFDALLKGE